MEEGTFAERIKRVRDRIGLTQTEFAALIGVTWVTVSRWERRGVNPGKPVMAIIRALELIVEHGKVDTLLSAIRTGTFMGGTPSGYAFIYTLAFSSK